MNPRWNEPPAGNSTPVVTVRQLVVTRTPGAICHVSDLQVTGGERVGICGPNGSGKTTLLRVLAGLEPHYEGECRVELSGRAVVYVHQSPYLFRGSVLDNVAYGLAARSLRRTRRRQIASDWLERLGIGHLAARNARTLSGGESRRVAIARAFAVQPRLLLLDEPLADLDDSGSHEVCSAIRSLGDTTVLIASPAALPPGIVDWTVRLNSPQQSNSTVTSSVTVMETTATDRLPPR